MDNVALLLDTVRCSGRDIAGVPLVRQEESLAELYAHDTQKNHKEQLDESPEAIRARREEAAKKQERMFVVPAGNEPEFDPRTSFKRMDAGMTLLPHGTHPKGVLVDAHRVKYGLFMVPQEAQPLSGQAAQPSSGQAEACEQIPKWGTWAPVRDGPCPLSVASVNQLRGMPHEYVVCVCEVTKPYELLCGHREPATPTEARLVREAVEAMFVGFIERMLVIQLKYLEIHNNYKLLSKDSIQRHAACAMLRKGPTTALSTSDFKAFHALYSAKVAPFEEALRTYDRPSLLQFFEKELGTLYIFGIPVMSTRVMRTEPGWRQANKFLEIVGSKLRLRLCVLGSSTELLLGEPVLEKCTADIVVVGNERARTAMLAFEVASTQDTAENPVKMFRTESTAFIVHHKWDTTRILNRDWNPRTYGPTQKVVVLLIEAILENKEICKKLLTELNIDASSSKDDALKAILRHHCTQSLIEYQTGEGLVNSYTFTHQIRGILHALFSKHTTLEDMHSWLVDTVLRPIDCGILQAILADHPENPAFSHVRLLMYTTDTWFGSDRLYTVLMLGCMAVSVCGNAFDVKTLQILLAQTHALAVNSLNRMAERAMERFKHAQYHVLSHLLNFDSIAAILTRQYHRNDGFVDETSLRFNSSFWMNILGYYVRLTNNVESLDAEIMCLVHEFLDDVLDAFDAKRPDLNLKKLCVPTSQPGSVHGFTQPTSEIYDFKTSIELSRRLNACFNIFSGVWDRYMSKLHQDVSPKTTCSSEPPAKRQKPDLS